MADKNRKSTPRKAADEPERIDDGLASASNEELQREIERHRATEARLERLNCILKAHVSSDQAMMRGVSETDYLQEACRIVVEDCGHAMVWIGFAEDDPKKTVRPVACAGFEEGYLDTLSITWADTERGRGPTGTAIRTGKPSSCKNMRTDPKFEPWREEAVRRGYASSLVLPLKAHGKTLGAVTIYSKVPNVFTKEETQLLSGLANDLAYGITSIRLRAENERADAERKRAEIELAWIASFPEQNPNPIVEVDLTGHPRYLNPAARRLFPDLEHKGPDHPFLAGWASVTASFSQEETGEIDRDVLVGDTIYGQSLYFIDDVQRIRIYGRDVTNRRLAEGERELTIEFLRLVNESTGTADLIRAAMSFFHRECGCEAVGVRLKLGDDYPYFEARGFPEEFVLAENQLCARDCAGNVVHDSAGYPIMECMCGNVIQGRFDPSKPFFTEHGSFWSSCTTEMLATSTEADRQARTRNRCNGEGYESVALLPLRVGGETLGLLQFNDRRRDRFSAQMIALWERLADHLAVAVAKFRAEEELAQSEKRFKALFTNMTEGFALHEMIYDATGRPVDYRFLEMNEAFERQTGLKMETALGRTVLEVIPDNDPYWVEIYGKVALTGESVKFEEYSTALDRWYRVYAFSPIQDQFAVLFLDITDRKKAEDALKKAWADLDVQNEELQALNEELTASNEEIECANEELRVTNDEILREIELRRQAEKELAQARIEAKQRAAELESFISSAVDGVGLIDVHGSIVWANDALRRILSVSPGDDINEWLSTFQRRTLDGDPIFADWTPASRALRGEVVKNFRFRATTPNGQEIVISVSAAPVVNLEGRVIGATTLTRDVTDEFNFERRKQELYQREHRIAETLQQVLIPSEIPTTIYNLTVGVAYQSALDEAKIGGDFYDVFELGNGKVGVLIGDVAGKGLQAAIRVAAVRYAIRSYAHVESSPSEVLRLTNETLCKDPSHDHTMLTALFTVFDTAAGRMTYACAGHQPPIICRDGACCEELELGGMPLGVIEIATYADISAKLLPGDSIVMVTDGITEARAPGPLFFGKEGLIDYLSRNRTASPKRIATGLLNEALRHSGGQLQDDVAVVAIRLRRRRAKQ